MAHSVPVRDKKTSSKSSAPTAELTWKPMRAQLVGRSVGARTERRRNSPASRSYSAIKCGRSVVQYPTDSRGLSTGSSISARSVATDALIGGGAAVSVESSSTEARMRDQRSTARWLTVSVKRAGSVSRKSANSSLARSPVWLSVAEFIGEDPTPSAIRGSPRDRRARAKCASHSCQEFVRKVSVVSSARW